MPVRKARRIVLRYLLIVAVVLTLAGCRDNPQTPTQPTQTTSPVPTQPASPQQPPSPLPTRTGG